MFKRDESQSNEIETVIGPSVKVEGDFTAAGNVVVEGAVAGNLKTEKFLRVGTAAKITADVQAGNAHIAGEIQGNLIVIEGLELTSTAKIYGDVVSKSLTVAAGAIIHGRCTVGEGKTSRIEKTEKIDRAEKPLKEKIARHKEWRIDDAMVKTKE